MKSRIFWKSVSNQQVLWERKKVNNCSNNKDGITIIWILQHKSSKKSNYLLLNCMKFTCGCWRSMSQKFCSLYMITNFYGWIKWRLTHNSSSNSLKMMKLVLNKKSFPFASSHWILIGFHFELNKTWTFCIFWSESKDLDALSNSSKPFQAKSHKKCWQTNI